MTAKEFAELLIKDHGDVDGQHRPVDGFRKAFAEDKPYMSFLQRNDKTLEQVLEDLDWGSEDVAWVSEYQRSANDIEKLIRYKREIGFKVGCWREFNEDFGRGDVSCLREIRTPLVTSRTPLKAMKDEFDE